MTGLGTGCGCWVGNSQLGHGRLGARTAVEKGRCQGGPAWPVCGMRKRGGRSGLAGSAPR
jgi:hypothetical protein